MLVAHRLIHTQISSIFCSASGGTTVLVSFMLVLTVTIRTQLYSIFCSAGGLNNPSF